jgi:hypothetical protein
MRSSALFTDYCTELTKLRVTLQLAIYRPSVHLGDKPLETHDHHFFQLNTCGHSPYVTYSLMTGWTCRLQLLLVLASESLFGPSAAGTHDHISLSKTRDSPNLEGQVPDL